MTTWAEKMAKDARWLRGVRHDAFTMPLPEDGGCMDPETEKALQHDALQPKPEQQERGLHVGHFMEKCVCGNILSQCRCPSKDKPVTIRSPCKCAIPSVIQPVPSVLKPDVPVVTEVPTEPELVRVVTAVIQRRRAGTDVKETLLVLRGNTKNFPQHWETPGGRVHDGDENDVTALKRELWEELGITIRPLKVLGTVAFSPPVFQQPHLITAFLCELAPGSALPKLQEDQRAYQWFVPIELGGKPLTIGTAAALRMANALGGWVDPHTTGSVVAPPRRGWDEYFMQVAQVASSRATCELEPTGAVLVRNKLILSTGYTGSIRDSVHCTDAGHLMYDSRCIRTVHAEANAVLQAACNGTAIEGATIYTTSDLCWSCFKMLANAGVKRIVSRDKLTDTMVLKAAPQAGIELVVARG